MADQADGDTFAPGGRVREGYTTREERDVGTNNLIYIVVVVILVVVAILLLQRLV